MLQVETSDSCIHSYQSHTCILALRLFYTEISMKTPLLVAYTFKLDQPASVNHFIQFCNDKPPRYVLLKGESEVEDKLEEGE